MNDTTTPLRLVPDPDVPDYCLGPAVLIEFDVLEEGYIGWWDPERQRILIHRDLRGRQLVETVLHEVAHMLCGDHGDALDDGDHDWLDEWATQAASLLELVRPGRRAVPA